MGWGADRGRGGGGGRDGGVPRFLLNRSSRCVISMADLIDS